MLIATLSGYIIGDILIIIYWYMCKTGAGTGMGAGIVMIITYILWYVGMTLNIGALLYQVFRITAQRHNEIIQATAFGLIFLVLFLLSYRASVFR